MDEWRHWLLVIGLGLSIILLSPCAGKTAEIGIAQAGPITCEQSMEDAKETLTRIVQLKTMYLQTTGSSGQLVLREEIQALHKLLVRIHIWRNENCKET